VSATKTSVPAAVNSKRVSSGHDEPGRAHSAAFSEAFPSAENSQKPVPGTHSKGSAITEPDHDVNTPTTSARTLRQIPVVCLWVKLGFVTMLSASSQEEALSFASNGQ